MLKILLINCPIRLDAKPNCIPYGLATIAAVLRKEGYEVELYDINALRPGTKQIIDTLSRKQWDIAGVSGLITTYAFQKWLITELKRIDPEAPVVSGGGLATSNPELLLSTTAVDIVAIGEGEETMGALCRARAEESDWQQVPGICYREQGAIVKTAPRRSIEDLDKVPLPAWDLLPMEIYLANPIWGNAAGNSSGFLTDVSVTRSMNIISSRGCPFGCNYCYHLFGRSQYRFRSAAHVIHEIETLVDQYRVDFVGFVDDNMMASEERLSRFCELMSERRVPVSWGCHGRVTSAKPRVLEQMADAGCIWIGYGIESGSQTMLERMNKKATVAQAKRAIVETRRAGIFPNTTFIFGYPGETRDTIQETIDFKRELGIECGSFYATPYPGTPLYDSIRHRIKDETAFIFSLGNATDFSINLTGFPDEEFFALKSRMDHNQDV
jgi:radical SAM superfamily enzyme YgiQ (UPF0313 family)